MFYISKINPLNSTDIEYSGLYKDIIDLLAQSLHFTYVEEFLYFLKIDGINGFFCRYKFIVPTEEEVAQIGPVEAAIGYLQRNVKLFECLKVSML